MSSAARKLIVAGVFLVFLGVAMALPREDDEKIKEIRSPAIDNDDFTTYQDEQPVEFSFRNLFSGRIGKFFNDFLQDNVLGFDAFSLRPSLSDINEGMTGTGPKDTFCYETTQELSEITRDYITEDIDISFISHKFPAVVFRFVSGIIANQPFAKLREEVRNLNISYPK